MGEVVGFIGTCLIFLFYVGVVISDIRKDGAIAAGAWVGIFIYTIVMGLALAADAFLAFIALFVLGIFILCVVIGE